MSSPKPFGQADAAEVESQAQRILELESQLALEREKNAEYLRKKDRHDEVLAELLKRIERLEKGRETGEQPATPTLGG